MMIIIIYTYTCCLYILYIEQCYMLKSRSIHVDKVFDIKLEESIAIEKMLGRRYCETCKGN